MVTDGESYLLVLENVLSHERPCQTGGVKHQFPLFAQWDTRSTFSDLGLDVADTAIVWIEVA